MSLNTLGDIFLVLGAAWTLLAAIGILKFDDVYSRMHALTKPTTLGVLLIIVGSVVHLGAPDAAKLALVGLFVFLTQPVGAHLIALAVTRWPGVARIRIDTINEMADPDDEPGGDASRAPTD
jgi:multicomponent Na+:H+ antiporter subunit G